MKAYPEIVTKQENTQTNGAPQEHSAHPAGHSQNGRTESRMLMALVETTAEKMRYNAELLQSFLDVQARFDRYSVNNAILITAQKPEASRLATVEVWNSEGITVREGESGISIFEPEREVITAPGKTGMVFKSKKVFDITQTTGTAEPPAPPTRNERLILKALITDPPCLLAISSDMPDSMNAQYRPDARTILVRPRMENTAIFQALSKELAHVYLAKQERKRTENLNAALFVSYILCRRFGISTDAFRFDAVPMAYQKMTYPEFHKELERIRSVANEISSEMHRKLKTELKEELTQ